MSNEAHTHAALERLIDEVRALHVSTIFLHMGSRPTDPNIPSILTSCNRVVDQIIATLKEVHRAAPPS